MPKRKVTCGLYIPAPSNLKDVITTLENDKTFSYAVVPLVHPGMVRGIETYSINRPLSRSCRNLECKDWSYLVGEVSRHIDVDSADEAVRLRSEKILLEEFNYAVHVNFAAVLIRLKSGKCANLARIINSFLTSQPQFIIWVLVTADNPQVALDSHRSDIRVGREHVSPWEWWNRLRSFCDSNSRLAVVLDVGADLPGEADRSRWIAEPVRALFLRTSLFLTNRRGYPVLSTAHQHFLHEFGDIGTQVILTGPNRHESLACYAYYLNYVWNLGVIPDENLMEDSLWADYLQCPLQPLMNNLEAQTYEVFEKDPVKYRVYREAVHEALLDRVAEEDKEKITTVVMVMGAGRGPLVQATLDAAKAADRKVRVYAVEKNPYAVITLQCRRDEEWANCVTVIPGDMRRLNLEEKADILVSELLGSFGDNELSPECLDGAQVYLKDDGISIPCEYTSFVCPVMSQKLYSEARACPVEPGKLPIAALETSYVVLQKNKQFIDKPVPLFTFKHPNRVEPIDNKRYEEKRFVAGSNCVLHGFSGFFETILYKEHMLSIVPETFSTGMFSWFPIYMPIQRPVMVQAGSEIVGHFWRQVSDRDVWYEWTISSPEPLPIHNVNGRSSKIGL